jgi:DNA-binding transcriptional LysR family regulator
MNLNHLRLFFYVATYQSFTIAAEKLFLTQPGISKQIRDLEFYYSCKLFERRGKKISLTHQGEILYNSVKKIFNILDSAKQMLDDFNQVKSGNIRILCGYTPGIHILPNAIFEFRNFFPGITIRYDISTSKKIFKKLISDNVDIGITALEGDDRFISIPFLSDEMVLVCPKNYFQLQKKKVTLNNISGHDILVTKEGSATRELVDDLNKRYNLKLKIIEIGNPFAITKSIESGNGISIMSKLAVDKEARKDRIQILPLKEITEKRSFFLNYRRDKYIYSAMSEFISFFLKLHGIISS